MDQPVDISELRIVNIKIVRMIGDTHMGTQSFYVCMFQSFDLLFGLQSPDELV